jgi:hypothetical protein
VNRLDLSARLWPVIGAAMFVDAYDAEFVTKTVVCTIDLAARSTGPVVSVGLPA